MAILVAAHLFAAETGSGQRLMIAQILGRKLGEDISEREVEL
jgi:hypothetical protein